MSLRQRVRELQHLCSSAVVVAAALILWSFLKALTLASLLRTLGTGLCLQPRDIRSASPVCWRSLPRILLITSGAQRAARGYPVGTVLYY